MIAHNTPADLDNPAVDTAALDIALDALAAEFSKLPSYFPARLFRYKLYERGLPGGLVRSNHELRRSQSA